MLAKTMEGLIGARNNMDMVNVPMRVYKEARRKGDTGTMERAMGYACDYMDEAEEYKKKAEEGMKQEAKEKAEEEKRLQEEAARELSGAKDREIPATNVHTDTPAAKGDLLEVSEEGRALLENSERNCAQSAGGEESTEKSQPVIYTGTGKIAMALSESKTDFLL